MGLGLRRGDWRVAGWSSDLGTPILFDAASFFE